MKKYLIIEQGSYSDYGVSVIDVTDCNLTNEEIYTVLKIDSYDNPSISGKISGEIEFYDNSSLDIKDLKKEIEYKLNSLFCCYDNRAYKTVLDKFYSKDELLKIAEANDKSGKDYWERCIDEKYKGYEEGYKIYLKLK